MYKWMSTVAILMMATILAACGGAPATTGGGTPEAATKTFVEASFSGNIEAARTVVCAAMAAMLTDEAAATMSAMAGVETDFSGLIFTASDVTDTSANVTVSGIMKIAGQEMNFADMVPGAAFPLIKEGGAWKVCQVA